MKYAHFGRIMRKPDFPLKIASNMQIWSILSGNNASNIRIFGASWEDLLRNVIMHQMYTLFSVASWKNLLFNVIKQQFAPFWRVMRKPAFPRNNAANLHLFWRVMTKPATKRDNALNVHFVFGRVMRKSAFPRINASNIRVFGVSWENLLFT